MYLPDAFNCRDKTKIQAMLTAYPFATLVSQHEGTMQASHIPVLYQADDDCAGEGWGSLAFHMAAANPLSQTLANGQQLLLMFHGPHAYISPSWYQAPGVPTWNYIAIHCYGSAQLLADRQALWQLLQRQTRQQEQRYSKPWEARLEPQQRERLFGKILGFELVIEVLEAKCKLSQNRRQDDRQGVIQALREDAGDMTGELAQWMAAVED